jgi:hypothetical protein
MTTGGLGGTARPTQRFFGDGIVVCRVWGALVRDGVFLAFLGGRSLGLSTVERFVHT